MFTNSLYLFRKKLLSLSASQKNYFDVFSSENRNRSPAKLLNLAQIVMSILDSRSLSDPVFKDTALFAVKIKAVYYTVEHWLPQFHSLMEAMQLGWERQTSSTHSNTAEISHTRTVQKLCRFLRRLETRNSRTVIVYQTLESTFKVSSFSCFRHSAQIAATLACFNPMNYVSNPIQQSNSRVFVSIADNKTEPQELQNDLKIVLVQREMHKEIDPAEICRMLRIMKSLAVFVESCDSTHCNIKQWMPSIYNTCVLYMR